MKEWTTPDSRNTPSTTNLEKEEIVDAPGNDGNASMPEQVKRTNPWRKIMMMIMMMNYVFKDLNKGKSVPLQAWSDPEGSRKLRFPDFMTTAQDGGKVVSLTHQPPLPPRK